jgi:hypothetical protein
MIIKFIKRLFNRKTSSDGLIGYWGVIDPTKDNECKIQGEMYSYDDQWIAGPKLWEDNNEKDLNNL